MIGNAPEPWLMRVSTQATASAPSQVVGMPGYWNFGSPASSQRDVGDPIDRIRSHARLTLSVVRPAERFARDASHAKLAMHGERAESDCQRPLHDRPN